MEFLQLNQSDFDRIYEIMEKSFPVDEHRPYAEQRALFDYPEYQIYGMKESGNDEIILSFAAIWEFENIVFIEHLAVDPESRNGGFGARMLKSLSEVKGKRLCLEVEPPVDELTKRRVRFYGRNGFYMNEFPYMQPALSAGQKEVPLLIMTTGGTVPEVEFYEIKDLLYRKVYHIK